MSLSFLLLVSVTDCPPMWDDHKTYPIERKKSQTLIIWIFEIWWILSKLLAFMEGLLQIKVLHSSIMHLLHLFITSLSGLQSCDEEQCWFTCFLFLLFSPSLPCPPPTSPCYPWLLMPPYRSILLPLSLFLLFCPVFFPSSESMLWISSTGRVGVKNLPGRYVAVVHVSCHHHPSSSPVALKRH